jgi:hypothetical protein
MRQRALILLFLFLPLFSYAGHKWVITYAKGTPYTNQGYVVTDSWPILAKEIDKRWKQGYDLLDIAQGYTKWVALYAKNTGMTTQAYVVRRVWADFRDALAQKYEEGYVLIDLEHGDDIYVGIFAKGTDSKEPTYTTADYFDQLREKIRKAWAKGYKIDFIRYYEGQWIAFMDKDPKMPQTLDAARTWKAFGRIVKQRWKEGYFLTDLHFGFDQWTGTFSKTKKFTAQSYDLSNKWRYLHPLIKKRWREGYQIVLITDGW